MRAKHVARNGGGYFVVPENRGASLLLRLLGIMSVSAAVQDQRLALLQLVFRSSGLCLMLLFRVFS